MAWVIDLCVILSRILAVISHHFGVNLKFIILNNKSIPKMFFNLKINLVQNIYEIDKSLLFIEEKVRLLANTER